MTPVIMPYHDTQVANKYYITYSISYKHIANLEGYTTSHAHSAKNELDRHLYGLLQLLSWLISRLHANVVPYTHQTRYFIVASLTFGVRAATNAPSQTSFNA